MRTSDRGAFLITPKPSLAVRSCWRSRRLQRPGADFGCRQSRRRQKLGSTVAGRALSTIRPTIAQAPVWTRFVLKSHFPGRTWPSRDRAGSETFLCAASGERVRCADAGRQSAPNGDGPCPPRGERKPPPTIAHGPLSRGLAGAGREGHDFDLEKALSVRPSRRAGVQASGHRATPAPAKNAPRIEARSQPVPHKHNH